MMPTDEERRHVARKLRLGGGPSLVKLMAYLHCGGNELFGRLADLIEPPASTIPTDPGEASLASVEGFIREMLHSTKEEQEE